MNIAHSPTARLVVRALFIYTVKICHNSMAYAVFTHERYLKCLHTFRIYAVIAFTKLHDYLDRMQNNLSGGLEKSSDQLTSVSLVSR